MKIDLLAPSSMFSIAELSAMAMDYEVFRYHDIYAAFWCIDTPKVRAAYLLLTTKRRARHGSLTARWVAEGGALPQRLDLVDAR